jgi:hypothetical protein
LVPFDDALIAVTDVVPGSTVSIAPAGTVIGPLQPRPPAEIVADACVVQGRSYPPEDESKVLTPGSLLVIVKLYVPVADEEFAAACLQTSTTPVTGSFAYWTVVVSDSFPALGAGLTVTVATPGVELDGVTVPGSPCVALMLTTLNHGAATSVTVAVPEATAIGDVQTCGPPARALSDTLDWLPASLIR